MPLTFADARAKNPSIKSDAEATMWVTVANKQLKALLAKGVEKAEAEKRALTAASKSVAEMRRKGGSTHESVEPVGDGCQLLEFVNSRGLSIAVDREKGLISGVKILGHQSKNGRAYLPEAVKQAAGLYEGKRVNVDHTEAGASRSYRDRMGKLQNIQVREDGLYGDLFVNPQHMLAEQLFWDAEHAPENVGLSHDVTGKVTRRAGKATVEAIETVRSVDLVANPATTAGLFEEVELEEEEVPTMEIDLKEVTLEQLTAERPELLEAFKKTLTDAEGVKAKDEQIKKLTEDLATIKADATKATIAAAIAKDLHEAKLDPKNETQCPAFFMEQLQAIPDAEKRKPIIEDRKGLVERAAGNGQPISESRHGNTEGGLAKMTSAQRGNSWRG